jgi:hypothetical protein
MGVGRCDQPGHTLIAAALPGRPHRECAAGGAKNHAAESAGASNLWCRLNDLGPYLLAKFRCRVALTHRGGLGVGVWFVTLAAGRRL